MTRIVVRQDGNRTIVLGSGIRGPSGEQSLSTKGDLLGHDGTSAVRVPVGADGRPLVADSTATAGVAWGDDVTVPGTVQGATILAKDSAGGAGVVEVQNAVGQAVEFYAGPVGEAIISGGAFNAAKFYFGGVLGASITGGGIYLPADTSYGSADEDSCHTFGRAEIGDVADVADAAGFAHRNNANATDYAFAQRADGGTYLNAKSGQTVSLRVNNSQIAAVNSGGVTVTGTLGLAGGLTLSGDTISGNGATVTIDDKLVVTGSGVYSQYLGLDSPDGSSEAKIFLRTDGADRWCVSKTDEEETGSNAGSNFSICRYADGGGYIDSPLVIHRDTGEVYFADRVHFSDHVNFANYTDGIFWDDDYVDGLYFPSAGNFALRVGSMVSPVLTATSSSVTVDGTLGLDGGMTLSGDTISANGSTLTVSDGLAANSIDSVGAVKGSDIRAVGADSSDNPLIESKNDAAVSSYIYTLPSGNANAGEMTLQASGSAIRMQLGGTVKARITSTGLSVNGELDVDGDVELASDSFTYYGDPNTNGSWRQGRSGDDFVTQRRESGSWVTKQTISA